MQCPIVRHSSESIIAFRSRGHRGHQLPYTNAIIIRYLRVSKAIRVMRNHKLLASIFSNDDFTVKTILLSVKVRA